MLELKLSVAGLERFETALSAAPEMWRIEEVAAITRSAFIAEGAIKTLTPVKTSRLRSAWATSVRPGVGVVGNTTVYAPMVEFGTKPHDIEPKKGKALRFKGRGGFVFAKIVHHPGTKGQHPAERGLEVAKPRILREFTAAIDRVLNSIKGV